VYLLYFAILSKASGSVLFRRSRNINFNLLSALGARDFGSDTVELSAIHTRCLNYAKLNKVKRAEGRDMSISLHTLFLPLKLPSGEPGGTMSLACYAN
jgi:hypothetical protein